MHLERRANLTKFHNIQKERMNNKKIAPYLTMYKNLKLLVQFYKCLFQTTHIYGEISPSVLFLKNNMCVYIPPTQTYFKNRIAQTERKEIFNAIYS